MSNDYPLRFVHLQKPGQKYQLEEHKALRKHVRRAIVREKKSRDIDQNIRIFTPSNWPVRRSEQRRHTPASSRGKQSHRRAKSRYSAPETLPHDQGDETKATLPQKANEQPQLPDGPIGSTWREEIVSEQVVLLNPICYHPFTVSASTLVNLPEKRLDTLFKSEIFRAVGEPCFDTSQIDANRNIDIVFPSSLSDPVFMHTLVYSMLQIQHQQQPSIETLAFERSTIKLLNSAIAKDSNPPSVPLIGAIMLLTAGAWRVGDPEVHKAHSSGLYHAVQLACSASDCPLSPAAARAIFWLDLFSSVLMDSQRRLSHFVLPSQPVWRRSTLPLAELFPTSYLPVGFQRHRRVITDDLLDCLEDIVELQSKMADPLHRRDYALLDDMQASIESRLSFHGRACRQFGEIAEMVRLAAFICCYCCWMDTWNSNLIPAKVANMLQKLIGKSITAGDGVEMDVWDDHIELLLWLLFVGASVSEQEKWYAIGLRQEYAGLMKKISDRFSTSECTRRPLHLPVKTILEQFLHCDDWLNKRMRMREWFALEILLDANLTCHDDSHGHEEERDSAAEASWPSYESIDLLETPV